MATAKEQFLESFDREHSITMRVLRAFPADKADLRPHPKLKTARELAWVFALERALGMAIWNDEFAKRAPSGTPPKPPEKWSDVLAAIEKAHQDFRAVIASASDATLSGKVHFFTAPKTMGETTRIDWIWFLLHDEIHHRGQFSIYMRFTDAKLPSIYGPTRMSRGSSVACRK
ncbi:MAG TPA: DinB family protein [Thermoanaerobaculia bacterium]|nr:DinB family protein [Thermoanaerobaculia bacterium]